MTTFAKVTTLDSKFIIFSLKGIKTRVNHTFWGFELTMSQLRYLTLADIDNIVSETIIAEQVIDLENYRDAMRAALIEYIYNL